MIGLLQTVKVVLTLNLCTVAGNTVTAAAHCITAVIGAGVLALPYSVGALGWAGGPVMIAMFAIASSEPFCPPFTKPV